MPEPYSASPPSNQGIPRVPLRDFLPLSNDPLSTRGQKLPALIQNRSHASLSELRGQQLQYQRRFSLRGSESEYGQEDGDGYGGEDGDRPHEETKTVPGQKELLTTPQVRSLRLIGNSNPLHQWEKYYKTEEELKPLKKPIRKYYERNNHLISQYLFIDRLLDSSLPHNLISEYDRSGENGVDIPQTIAEELLPGEEPNRNGSNVKAKVKRTPKALYHVPTTDENTPLLDDGAAEGPKTSDIEAGQDEGVDSNDPIVTLAIYINLAANTILLVGKIAVMVLTDSLSVLASLVDAALDFLSTAIVWVTSTLIARQDRYAYPVGRRRLEPIGVLIFSVIMITSFFQVFLECFNRLISSDRSVVELGIPAVVIMASTVLIKFCCWLWCRFIKNSSVQALAQDAMTDVVFNTFSIIFPLIGHYAQIWYLDPLGGLLLSLFVILNWAFTSASHIRNLTGRAAAADERNVLLYLTMRFARTIKSIQGLQAYHAGDKLNVEVDIVLDESIQLRDSHDLGESLQYMLESVPVVDRAFVHMDYRTENLPTHMEQQE